MKIKRTMTGKPGKELTFSDLIRFVETVRGDLPPDDVAVKATVRFNGTLRGISCEWEGDEPGLDSNGILRREP